MLDGHLVFTRPSNDFHGGWQLDQICDRLWDAGVLDEFIIVGLPSADHIATGNRKREFCPHRYADPGADAFSRWLHGVVKPNVDSLFRTRPEVRWNVM